MGVSVAAIDGRRHRTGRGQRPNAVGDDTDVAHIELLLLDPTSDRSAFATPIDAAVGWTRSGLGRIGATLDRADEVVRAHRRDGVAGVTRPVRELQGFARTMLDTGRSAKVIVRVPGAARRFAGRDVDDVVEPGEIECSVGTSSGDITSVGSVVVAGDAPIRTVRARSATIDIEPVCTAIIEIAHTKDD